MSITLNDAPGTEIYVSSITGEVVRDATRRERVWNYVGSVRTTRRLERALHRIELLRSEIDDYYANFRVNRDLLELRNLVDCAELVVRSALMRRESRGLHYTLDYPQKDDVHWLRDTVVMKGSRS